MAYYYRGKRYERKGVKAKLGRFASRVWQNVQGGHLEGHREEEHYVDQTMREVEAKLNETNQPKGEDQ